MPFAFLGARLTASLPTAPPSSIAAGESYQWQWAFGDYAPSDGYALKVYVRGVGAFDVSATSDAGYWLVTLAASETEELAAGDYTWVAYTEKGADATLERWPYASGVLTVTPNLVRAKGGEQVSFAAQMVDALKERLSGRVGAGQDLESYGLAGRTVQKIPFQQLRAELASWQMALWRERNPGKLAPAVKVTFSG